MAGRRQADVGQVQPAMRPVERARTPTTPGAAWAGGGVLSAAGVLQLQRAAGNGAVSGRLAGASVANLAVPALVRSPALRLVIGAGESADVAVQRRLPADKTIGPLVVAPSTVTLAARIREFNKRESKLTPIATIEALNVISRYVYRWYAQQDTKDLASLAGKDVKAVRKLEDAIVALHEKAVAKLLVKPKHGTGLGAVNVGNVNPVNPTRQQRALLLLQSIASGTGPIKIVGAEAFKRKAHSMLYRIMESPAGLRLLEAIAVQGGATRTVTIGEGDPPPELRGHLSEASPKESKAVPQVTKVGEDELQNTKEEAAKTLTNMTKLTDAPAKKSDYLLVADPGDISTAVMTGKRGIKVGNGTGGYDYWQFAQGAVGVYVALISKNLGEDTDNMNQTGGSVLTPQFVTLGHELGHALSILAGSATITCEELFALFAGDVGTFDAPTATRNNWSNAEEFGTISFIENKIRQDLGLELRGGHAAVIEQSLDDRMQRLKGMTRMAPVYLYTLSTSPATQPLTDRERTKLDDLSNGINRLSMEPVKGLSPTQKRARCTEYETAVRVALKTVTGMGKKFRDEAKLQLGGTYLALKTAIELDAPDIIPPALR